LWRLRLHQGLPCGEIFPRFENRKDLRRNLQHAAADYCEDSPAMKSMRVLYHDHCFDGVSSAAVFSRFYRAHVDRLAEIQYEGLTHKAGQLISMDSFGPD